MIMSSGFISYVSILVTIGIMRLSSALSRVRLGQGLSIKSCLAICIMAVLSCRLPLISSRKISTDTFSLSEGLMMLKNSDSWFYSYCVPCVEIKYIRMSRLVSGIMPKLFMAVLATSTCFCKMADFLEASPTNTDI